MPIAERSAQTTWKGSLAEGAGTLTSGSGALGELPVTWASRTERSEGKTSPEELIAAAHASCFSMALSHELTQGGQRARAAGRDGRRDARQSRRRADRDALAR